MEFPCTSRSKNNRIREFWWLLIAFLNWVLLRSQICLTIFILLVFVRGTLFVYTFLKLSIITFASAFWFLFLWGIEIDRREWAHRGTWYKYILLFLRAHFSFCQIPVPEEANIWSSPSVLPCSGSSLTLTPSSISSTVSGALSLPTSKTAREDCSMGGEQVSLACLCLNLSNNYTSNYIDYSFNRRKRDFWWCFLEKVRLIIVRIKRQTLFIAWDHSRYVGVVWSSQTLLSPFPLSAS